MLDSTADDFAERLVAALTETGATIAFDAIGGGVLGWLSLLMFPKMVFAEPGIAIFYFIVSPIVAGLVLMTVSWLIDRGINNSRWLQPAKFIFGVVFALGYSLSRVAFS